MSYRSPYQKAIAALEAQRKNKRSVQTLFRKLFEESGEIVEAAWNKDRQHIGEELADTAIALFLIAERHNLDLLGEVTTKLEKLETRWTEDGTI